MCTPGRAEEVAGCPPAVGVTELEERFVECGLALLRVGGGMFSCTDMAGEGEQSEGEVDTVAGGVTYTLSVWRMAQVEAALRVNILHYVNFRSRDLPHHTSESSSSRTSTLHKCRVYTSRQRIYPIFTMVNILKPLKLSI